MWINACDVQITQLLITPDEQRPSIHSQKGNDYSSKLGRENKLEKILVQFVYILAN